MVNINKRKNGKIYKKMYQTYILILCVPILLSIFFYYYTYREVINDALLYNSNLNNTIKNVYDAKIQYYKGIIYQLRLNDDVNMMVKNGGYTSSDSYWESYVVQKLLDDMKESMRSNEMECLDVFLYLTESDKVLCSSSVLSYQHYNQQVLNMDEANAEVFKKHLMDLEKEELYCPEDNFFGGG